MVSVLMSVYNENNEWIKKAIDSILNQTYNDLELIITVDNPELDSRAKMLLENYSAEDKRVFVFYNEKNIGLANSLNYCFSHSRGEFLARMDADDISEPTRLEEEYTFLSKNESVDMVATNRVIIDENDDFVVEPKDIVADPNAILPFESVIVHPSVMMRRSVFCELDGYRDFPRSQDYDLWLRMLTSDKKIAIMNKRLLRYRIRRNSLTNKNRLQQFYINQFQKRLYKERLLQGTDSFSRERLDKYLESKKITPKKNERCINAFKVLDDSTKSVPKRVFIAFFTYPSITMMVISNNIKKRWFLWCNRSKVIK